MKQCPKCFAPQEEAGLACSSPHCNRAGIPVAVAAAQKDEKGRPVCAACAAPMTLKVCTQCGFELGDAEGAYLPISLVGSAGSGKSNYLSVLIRQLGSEFCTVYGSTLYPTGGDRTMAHFEREYHRPLFSRGVCVPPTREGDLDPLTYTLVFPRESEAGKTCGLAFYDTAGANLESEADMALWGRSIYHSKGILFVVDPSQFPAVREARRAKKLSVVDHDPQALLLRTVHLLRAGLGLESVSKKIPVHLAVCLAKMDTVRSHLDPASFLGDPSRNLRKPMVSASDLDSCSLEAQSLVETWGGREFLSHVRSQFSSYAFFGLSALGNAPGEQNEIPKVLPHRALDPLLWLLWKHQIIRAG